MDDLLKKSQKNANVYRETLERIIAKFSNLHDNETEVNLENMTTQEVSKHMARSEMELLTLELSKSDAELSLGDISEIRKPQDTTADFKMDISYHQDDSINDPSDAGSVDGTSVTAHSKDSQDNVHCVNSTMLSEMRNNLWRMPEEQDEELEQSLCSQRSVLPDLYPRMLSQIQEAWRRQHVSDVAAGVLRRYNKLRWFSGKKQQNRTFDQSLTLALRKSSVFNCSRPSILQMSRNTTLNQSDLESPARLTASLLQTERLTPMKKNDSRIRQPPRPVQVIDFSHYPSADSGPPSYPLSSAASSLQESPKLEKEPLNQTFAVSIPSSPRPTTRVFSPATSGRLSIAGGFTSPTQKKGLSTICRQRVFPAGRSVESNDMFSSTEMSFYEAAHSPYKARSLSSGGQWSAPPNTNIYRSPKLGIATSHERNMSSVPRSSPASFRKPHLSPSKPYQNSHSPSQLINDVSRSSQQEHTLPKRWRSYSLDSVSSSVALRQNSKQIDKDFKKLYHTFVCQAKSCPSCCVCEKLSQSTRSPSSLSLAALALSPHHSAMRKRRREANREQSPESKRFRDRDCVYSPGSQRQRREMLRAQNHSDHHWSSTVLSSAQRNISHSCKPTLIQAYYSPHHRSSDAAIRKATGCTSGLNIEQHSPAWREKYNRFVGIQERSPVKAVCQSGCSPRFSRRRLLYK